MIATNVKTAIAGVASLGTLLALTIGTAASAAPSAQAAPAPDTAQTATTQAAAGHTQLNGGLSVKDYTILGPIQQNARVAGRDNGQSVAYHGKSYWFFDDTTMQNPWDFLSSTAAVTSDLNASDGITLLSANPFDEHDTGTPTEFVPYSAAENAFTAAHAATSCTGSTDPYCGTQFAFWPGSVVADPSHHRILVFYGKLCRGGLDSGPCASGFVGQAIASGIVSVDMRTGDISRMNIEHQDPSLTTPEGSDPTMLFTPAQNWGNGGSVLVGNELYAYGKCDSANNCGVARVPISQVQDRAAWRFYTGNDSQGRPQWSTNSDAAISVMVGGAAGETVNYDPTTNLYWDTFMPAYSDRVEYQTAPHPWGPWTTPTTMFTTPNPAGSTEYAAFAHPEYTTNHGLTRYYTYYTTSTGAQMLVKVDFQKA